MTVNTGDTIRSYDFKPMVGREDCFIEGVVLGVNSKMGYRAYEIEVTKDSWSDRVRKGRLGKIVFVPTKVAYMDYAGRVINLSRI